MNIFISSFILCALCFLWPYHNGLASAAEIPQIFQRQKDSLVMVHVNDKTGKHVFSSRGFVVDGKGLVAIGCNVVVKWLEEIENTVVIEAEGGVSIPMVRVVSDSCRNNFVVIRVQSEDLHAVTLSQGFKSRQGESVVIMKRTSKAGIAVLNGKVVSVGDKADFFRVSASVEPEMDGSPVFNPKGEAIGILILPRGKRQSQHLVVSAGKIAGELGRFPDAAAEQSLAPRQTVPPGPPAAEQAGLPPVSVPIPSERPQPEKKPDSAEQAFSRGLAYEKANMHKEAAEAYKSAVRIKPDFTEAYVSLGLLNYKLGKYADSAEAYKSAIKLNPKAIPVYNKLGATYILLGEYPKAIEAFKESLKIDPNNSEAHFNLGVAYVITEDKQGAIGEYTILKKFDAELADKLLDLIY